MERTQPNETEANFSIDEYGAKTAEKEECEEQLLAEYATLLGCYLASAAVLTGIAVQQHRLPKKFGLLDLALLGIATHKLSRIVAKDRITGILRAPFVSYIRSVGAGEVEAALLAHPGVKEAAVVGEPHADLGQAIVAYVVADAATGDELIDFVARTLSSHKRPRRVELIDELPRNAMGKVQKKLLTEGT